MVKPVKKAEAASTGTAQNHTAMETTITTHLLNRLLAGQEPALVLVDEPPVFFVGAEVLPTHEVRRAQPSLRTAFTP